MHPSRLPRLLVLALLLGFSGCMSWKARNPETGVAPVVSTDRPVRITRADYSVLTLEFPVVVGDSLIGMVGNPPQRSATAWRELRLIEYSRVSAVRTGAAMGAGGTVLLTVLLLVGLLALLGGGGLERK